MHHPLARRVLADCLEGELTRGALTLRTSGAWRPGMAGALGLWRFFYHAATVSEIHPMLGGHLTENPAPGGGARAMTAAECEAVMRLRPTAWEGGRSHREADEIAARPLRLEAALEDARAAAFATWKAGVLTQRDEALKAEDVKLRRWAEEEEAALTMRQTAMKKQVDALATPSAEGEDFVARMQRNKARAVLEKERRGEEERLFLLGAAIHGRREALMGAARARSDGRFSCDALFIVDFRVVE